MRNKLLDRISNLIKTDEEKYYIKTNINDENKLKIEKLKNKYKGKRCFILGSSPSLNMLDLKKLNNEYVFTVNRGYMLKEKGLNHSTFHVISDRCTFKDDNTKSYLLGDFSDILFCYAGMEKPSVNLETIYFDYISAMLNKEVLFQDDLLKPLIAYESVVHFAIQIAYYLGFSKIYLLGVDLDFAINKGHIYNETDGEKERQMTHSIKMANVMLDGLDNCWQFLANEHVKLYNASPAGVVDCMPRAKYEELF